jgi:hypothetical protein
LFGDLPPVHLTGQLDVGDQHVGDPPPAPCHRLFPVTRVDHVVALLAQRFDHDFPDKRVILHDKYSHRLVPQLSVKSRTAERLNSSSMSCFATIRQASHAAKKATAAHDRR